MKTIGLLGGMSWESSLEYYRIINEETKRRLGGSHSAKCLMYSFDFHAIEEMQKRGEWEKLTEELTVQANNLKNAGADFLIICTNTMHLMAPAIAARTGLYVLHIADAAGAAIKEKGLQKAALLGTNFTMQGAFYREVLQERHGIQVIIPEEEDREIIHSVIYNELILGIFRDESRKRYLEIIERLAEKGAEGVVLGCTEIPLLIKQEDTAVPVFDTTDIHARAAVRYALEDENL